MNRFIYACKVFFKILRSAETVNQFEKKSPESKCVHDYSHLRLLTLLQKEGRLIDFFKEDISQFTDAQIGAAIRKIHGECNKSLEEFVTLRPLFQEGEGTSIIVPQGYDPAAIKIVGKVKGAPPYHGVVRHRGWKAHKLTLPSHTAQTDDSIVCPAEVEVK